jgi:hypothetical protein
MKKMALTFIGGLLVGAVATFPGFSTRCHVLTNPHAVTTQSLSKHERCHD